MTRAISPRAAFRRRLLILLAGFLVAGTAMAAQMFRLGVLKGDQALAEAERRLFRERWVPTVRGRVLDRHGRVLAQNRPAYEVAVDYEVLSGVWARKRAVEHARRSHADAWAVLSGEQREELISRSLPLFEAHVAAMESRLARALGMDPEELRARRGKVIASVERLSRSITQSRLETYIREHEERGGEVTPQMREAFRSRASQPLAEEREPHVLVEVPDDMAFALERMSELYTSLRDPGRTLRPDEIPGVGEEALPLMPGMIVRRSEEREYPFDRVHVTMERSGLPGPLASADPLSFELEGVAAHVLGWMGPRATAEDVERRDARLAADEELRIRSKVTTLDGRTPDRGRYRPGDAAGRTGVEFSQESVLRGLRGLRIDRLDTGEQRFVAAQPGRDVRLTLDISLQARVQAVLQPEMGLAVVQPWQGENPVLPVGTALNGAAVVVEVDSGDVLALVSMPEISRTVMAEDPDAVFGDEVNKPYLNRATAGIYPPGSVLKALVLSGAVTHGNHMLGERIACNGHLIPDRPDILRCWIYRDRFGMSTHSARFGHDLDAVDALTVSCNIFFYSMGRRMGPGTIAGTLHEFGVGERWDLGIGAEFPGRIGGAVTDASGAVSYPNDGTGLGTFDATLMGIGQGPVAWTPLHAASAYATLARMGVYITPRIIDDGRGADVHETSLDRRGVEAALRGLDRVVNDPDYGTARSITFETGDEPIFSAPGVHVWGKTGTATAPPYDPDGRGPIKPIDEVVDHAWVTILVGPEGDRPRYAISVIMEYAGSGGKVSGPIANQIIHALIAEGYL